MADKRKQVYRLGDFRLGVGEHRLKRGDEEVLLQRKAFEMFVYLVECHGHLVEKRELLDAL